MSILQGSILLTNEPPEGLKANLLRAYGNFSEDIVEGCAKPTEYRLVPDFTTGDRPWAVCVWDSLLECGAQVQHARCGLPAPERWSTRHVRSSPLSWHTRPCRSILFALSFFHATLLERKKFGVGNQPGARSGIGWNMGYPFNLGDLLCCGQLAANYLDNSSRVSGLLRQVLPTVWLPGYTPNLQAVHTSHLSHLAAHGPQFMPTLPSCNPAGALGGPPVPDWRDHVRRPHRSVHANLLLPRPACAAAMRGSRLAPMCLAAICMHQPEPAVTRMF